MSWKTKKCYAEDVFKTSLVRLHQDVLSLLLYVHCYLMFLKESWKHLEDVLRKRFEDVFKTSLEEVLQTCLEEVLGDEKLLHRRGLQDVFKTSSRRIGKREIFASFKVFAPNYPSRLLKLLRSKINSSLERKYYIHEKLLTKCSWILNKTFWKKTTWHRINLFKMVEKKYSLLDLSCFCINLSFAVTQMHLHFYGVMVTHFNCLSWLLLLDYYQ